MTDLPERFDLASRDPLSIGSPPYELCSQRHSARTSSTSRLFDARSGSGLTPGPERFGLTWPGKAECMRVIQQPSIGTLVPMATESVDFDATGNVIIEGDNLEVLKLLQKAYYGKVKMIYIDPPYNTGQGVHLSRRLRGLADYLRYSGQVDAEGLKLSANAETDGRNHSKWLTMMYPRLFLARNLLREDGVIFVSIDDHEVHNLRRSSMRYSARRTSSRQSSGSKMDSPKNSAVHLGEDHEYILIYARDAEVWRPNLLPRTEEMTARYRNPDSDARGPGSSAISRHATSMRVAGIRSPLRVEESSRDPRPGATGALVKSVFESSTTMAASGGETAIRGQASNDS